MSKPFTRRAILLVIAVSISVSVIGAQTVITAPPNKYSPSEDVQLGREAAAQAEKQLPILHDDGVSSYVQSIGRRLADAIPSELQHREFTYSFKVVNVREINAFALPGGPMYVNRGMIEKAQTEGQIASVMAHEMSHVALRHGTAQATKATKYEIGAVAGAVLGAIIGGNVGSVVAQGTQFGLGTAFLRFSREYERQADILGSHIMASVGYDPREMASMFKLIEKEGGPGGPQWLSDHPNPGDRYAYITREAQSLQIQHAVHDTRGFEQVQARLRRMAPAPTTEEATRSGAGRGSRRSSSKSPGLGPVERPSSRYTTYTEGNRFRVSVPSNWRELASSNAVTFAPDGAYGNVDGQSVFTHGMEIGLTRNETHNLRTATDELINSLASSNPNLSRPTGTANASIDGRQGLRTELSNISDATGQQERIQLYSALLRDGSLFYALGVVPRAQFSDYQGTFRQVVGSIRIMD